MKYQQGMAADRDKTENDRKDKNYDRLVELITKTGYTPSQEELEQSGMTQAQAEAYLKRYGGGGGGGGSSIPMSYYYGGRSKQTTTLTKAQQKIIAAGGTISKK